MKEMRGLIVMIFVCLTLCSCATGGLRSSAFNQKFVQPHIVEPIKEEAQDFKENALRFELFSIIAGGPQALIWQKGYDIASLLLAPIINPLEKEVINPYVRRPINLFVFQPLVVKPLGWMAKRTGLIKEPSLKRVPWYQRENLYTLYTERVSWQDRVSVTRDPFHPTWMIDHEQAVKRAAEIKAKYNYYFVQAGDTLWSIAKQVYGSGQSYSKLAQINQLKEPYVLSIGQVLSIPADVKFKALQLKVSRRSAYDEPKPFVEVGLDPYTGTAFWAIDNFDLPETVKVAIKEKIANKDFADISLERGQILNQMSFGRNKISGPWICAWPQADDSGLGADQKAAWHFSVEHSGLIYHIVQIFQCHNWAWWIETPPRLELGDVKFLKISEKPIDISFRRTEKKKRFYLEPHWEASSGGFMERFENKTDVYGRWHIFSLFPLVYIDSKGRKHQLGFSIENIWWKGSTRDRFAFEGGKSFMFGPSYKVNTAKSETYARLLYGKREDKGFIHNERMAEVGQINVGGKTFTLRKKVREKYKMWQDTTILSFYLSHERWRPGKKWFRKIRFYTLSDYDLGNKKRASERRYDEDSGRFITRRVSAVDDNKDMYSAGFWLEIYDFKNGLIRPSVGFEAKYYAEGHKTGVRPGFGISFLDDGIFIGTNYTFWNKHNANSWGLECWVDFFKLYKHFKNRSWSSQARNMDEIIINQY